MANTYLAKTLGTPTENKKWTLSVWCKRSSLAAVQTIFSAGASSTDTMSFSSSGSFNFYVNAGNSGRFASNRLFRDTSAWYHVVLAADSTQSTAANRMKLYINGVQETSFSNATYPSVNYSWKINSAVKHSFGGYSESSSGDFWNGSMSHIHFCDGTQLAPTVFGSTDSTTGQWKINTSPSFTLGNNGFTILKDGKTITDQSSNSNNFALGGGTLTKTEDCPDNVFSTLNVLQGAIAAGYTIANGNLSTNGTSSNTWRSLPATLASSSGKFYWEIKVASFSYAIHFGIQDVDQAVQTDNYAYQYSRAYMYLNDGTKNNGGSGSSYGNSWTANDIIGVALDMDNLKLYFSKNGVFQNSGDPTSGSTGTGSAFTLASGYAYTPMFSSHSSSDKYQINFGNGHFGTTAVSSAGTNASGNGVFEYDVPTGYTALSTKGLNL